MKQNNALSWLIPMIVVLALISAAAGWVWQGGEGPFTVTTLHNETVQMSGEGLYQNATQFDEAAYRGTDIVTIFLGLPLLVISYRRYKQGSLRGGLLLVGALAYFLYYAASRGLDTPYNDLYLVYLALFSASFFAFILAFTAIELPALPERISERLPRGGLAIFMFVAGLGTAIIWLSDAMSAVIAGRVPAALGPHTTLVTYTIDVGIIAPAAVLAGILLLRRAPLGYLLTAILTIMLAQVGAMVIWQTIIQLSAEVPLSPGELIGKVGTWILMGGVAIWLTFVFLRNTIDSTA